MNSLKTVIVVSVMAVVAYGVYATLTRNSGDTESQSTGPQIDLGKPGASATTTAAVGEGGFAPKYIAGGPPGEAPRFEPTAPAETPVTPPIEAPVAGAVQSQFDPATGAAPPVTPGPPVDPGVVYPATTLEGPAPTQDAASIPVQGYALAADPAAAEAAAVPPTPDAGADGRAAFVAAMQSAQALLDAGQLAEAHLALSSWYDDPRVPADERARFMQLLDQLAGTVVYSRQHLLEPAYEVQAVDTLQDVASRYQVPWQLLAKINGIDDPARIRPGQQLKVMRGPFGAIVDLSDYQLTLWINGRYAGRFPVGLGQPHSAPPGEYDVRNKVENPAYYGPDGIVSAEDPTNPLGERWIDLGDQIGIHGTPDPKTIGSVDTRGCTRLSADDMQHVYDILSLGSKVVIRP